MVRRKSSLVRGQRSRNHSASRPSNRNEKRSRASKDKRNSRTSRVSSRNRRGRSYDKDYSSTSDFSGSSSFTESDWESSESCSDSESEKYSDDRSFSGSDSRSAMDSGSDSDSLSGSSYSDPSSDSGDSNSHCSDDSAIYLNQTMQSRPSTAKSSTRGVGASRLAMQAALALQRRKKESPILRASLERRKVREVDYDRNPTRLFQYLEKSMWREAAERCRTTPTDALTWVYRSSKMGGLLWRMLPIHTAVLYRAPVYVLLDLLDANPDGSFEPDDRKMLPIHMGCRIICKEDVLRVLLKHNPGSLKAEDIKGRTPMKFLKDQKKDKKQSRALQKVSARNRKQLMTILRQFEEEAALTGKDDYSERRGLRTRSFANSVTSKRSQRPPTRMRKTNIEKLAQFSGSSSVYSANRSISSRSRRKSTAEINKTSNDVNSQRSGSLRAKSNKVNEDDHRLERTKNERRSNRLPPRSAAKNEKAENDFHENYKREMLDESKISRSSPSYDREKRSNRSSSRQDNHRKEKPKQKKETNKEEDRNPSDPYSNVTDDSYLRHNIDKGGRDNASVISRSSKRGRSRSSRKGTKQYQKELNGKDRCRDRKQSTKGNSQQKEESDADLNEESDLSSIDDTNGNEINVLEDEIPSKDQTKERHKIRRDNKMVGNLSQQVGKHDEVLDEESDIDDMDGKYEMNVSENENYSDGEEQDCAVSLDESGDQDSESLCKLWMEVENQYDLVSESQPNNKSEQHEKKEEQITSKSEKSTSRRKDKTIRFYEPPNELKKLLLIIQSSPTDEKIELIQGKSGLPMKQNKNVNSRRINACGALKALAKKEKNKLRLARTKGVISSLCCILIEDSSTLEERLRCSTTLLSLSVPNQNWEAITNISSDIFDTYAKIMQSDCGRVLYNICFSLFLLAKLEGNRNKIISNVCLLKAASHVLQLNVPDDDMLAESENPQINSNLGSPSGIRQQGSPSTNAESNRGSRLCMLKTLLSVAKVKDSSYRIAREKEIITLLTKLSGSMAAQENLLCLAIFTNLTRHKDNGKYLIGEYPDFADILLKGAASGDPECQKCANLALQNLSCEKVCRQNFAKYPLLVPILSKSVLEKEANLDTRLSALYTLKNLCNEASYVVAMTENSCATAALLSLAKDYKNPMFQYIACDALAVLSQWLYSSAETCMKKNDISITDRSLGSKVYTWDQWH